MPADIVFGIHQDTSLERLRQLTSALVPTRLLIVSTHQPYPDEVEQLNRLAPEVKLVTFADLLTETEMAACDDLASQQGVAALADRGRRRYYSFFMERSRWLKNERVLAHLHSQEPVARLFHAEGLGIDGNAWSAAGSTPLGEFPCGVARSSLANRIRRLLRGEVVLLTATAPERRAIILGSAERIPLSEGVRVTRITWPLEWGVTPARLNAAALAGALRARGISSVPATYTTVHGYHPNMGLVAEACGQALRILADGHHPSNYSASYIESFGDGEFVVANPMSSGWFQRHGRHVTPGAWFQASPKFLNCTAKTIRRVMLTLNHAGDWSALIERSDTDRLVLAFEALARRWPGLEFVLRVHPTMATPEHEGVNAIHRIRNFVVRSELPNLAISDRTLQDDLERGDVYLSEYSQVLIDAWQLGKLGAAVNLTGRRSFMADYEALGFHAVDSLERLERFIRAVSADPGVSVAMQNRAVARYNAILARWEGTNAADSEGASLHQAPLS